MKDIPTFEQLNSLDKIFFELSLFSKANFVMNAGYANSLSPRYINKKYCEEQVVPLLYEDHYCFKTNLHNFCSISENYKHSCRRCLCACGS